MAKKKYLVDVYRTLSQFIEVEAETADEAETKAVELDCDDKLEWSVDMLTCDIAGANVCGEVDEKGERQYY